MTSGATYYFRYKAKNPQGWSISESPVTSIIMASVPIKIIPSVATTNNGVNVDISWTSPIFNGGTGVTID